MYFLRECPKAPVTGLDLLRIFDVKSVVIRLHKERSALAQASVPSSAAAQSSTNGHVLTLVEATGEPSSTKRPRVANVVSVPFSSSSQYGTAVGLLSAQHETSLRAPTHESSLWRCSSGSIFVRETYFPSGKPGPEMATSQPANIMAEAYTSRWRVFQWRHKWVMYIPKLARSSLLEHSHSQRSQDSSRSFFFQVRTSLQLLVNVREVTVSESAAKPHVERDRASS